MGLIQHKAEELRKREPSLSREPKIYCDPANRDLRAAERWANGHYEFPLEEEAPAAITKAEAMSRLNAKAAELCKSNPNLTEAQAFSKVFTDPRNRELALAERAASRALLGA